MCVSNSGPYFKNADQSMSFTDVNLPVKWEHLNWSFSWLADIKSHSFWDLIMYKLKVFSLGRITPSGNLWNSLSNADHWAHTALPSRIP